MTPNDSLAKVKYDGVGWRSSEGGANNEKNASRGEEAEEISQYRFHARMKGGKSPWTSRHSVIFHPKVSWDSQIDSPRLFSQHARVLVRKAIHSANLRPPWLEQQKPLYQHFNQKAMSRVRRIRETFPFLPLQASINSDSEVKICFSFLTCAKRKRSEKHKMAKLRCWGKKLITATLIDSIKFHPISAIWWFCLLFVSTLFD